MQQTPAHPGPKAPPALPEPIERKRQSDHREPRRTMNELFRTFANGTAKVMGSPWTFFGAVLLIIVWASSYRLFVPPGANEDQWKKGFDTWQLIINTATTIITFLMVFLIQNTQNRDAKAIHLKLDELIRALAGARTHLVDLENLTDEELNRLEREFRRIHEREKRKSEVTTGASRNGKH
jgi:low affinity Fe/Cu permease